MCNLSNIMETKLEAALEAKVKKMGVNFLKSEALKVLQKKLVPYISRRVQKRYVRVIGKLAANRLKATFADRAPSSGGGLTGAAVAKFGLKGTICCGAKALCKALNDGVDEDVDNAEKDAEKEKDKDGEKDAEKEKDKDAEKDAEKAKDKDGGDGGDGAGGDAGDAGAGADGDAGDSAEDVTKAANKMTRGVKDDIGSDAADAEADAGEAAADAGEAAGDAAADAGADAAADAGADAAVDAGTDAMVDAGADAAADLAVDAAADSVAGPVGAIVLGVQVGAVCMCAVGGEFVKWGEELGGPFGKMLVWYATALLPLLLLLLLLLGVGGWGWGCGGGAGGGGVGGDGGGCGCGGGGGGGGGVEGGGEGGGGGGGAPAAVPWTMGLGVVPRGYRADQPGESSVLPPQEQDGSRRTPEDALPSRPSGSQRR